MLAVDAHVEASPGAAAARQSVCDRRDCIDGKTGVRMQEQQNLAARDARPGVHLHGAPGFAAQAAVDETLGQLKSRIAAAAVDQNDLMTDRAQRLQVLERRTNASR